VTTFVKLLDGIYYLFSFNLIGLSLGLIGDVDPSLRSLFLVYLFKVNQNKPQAILYLLLEHLYDWFLYPLQIGQFKIKSAVVFCRSLNLSALF
jgi:hypothetical protein